jgi:hypothetical protein
VRVAAFLAGFNWTLFLDRLNRAFAGSSSSGSSTGSAK